MPSGEPARRRTKIRGESVKALVGGNAAVLGQVAGSQDQVDLRLFGPHQFDDLFQAVTGVHAEQSAIRFGKQMAVRQLHQQDRAIGGMGRRARQGPTPERVIRIMGGEMQSGKPDKREPVTFTQ